MLRFLKFLPFFLFGFVHAQEEVVHSVYFEFDKFSLDEKQLGGRKPPVGAIVEQRKALIPDRMHQSIIAKIKRALVEHRFNYHIEQPRNRIDVVCAHLIINQAEIRKR